MLITFNVVIMRIHISHASPTQYLRYLKNQQPCRHDKYESNMKNLHALLTLPHDIVNNIHELFFNYLIFFYSDNFLPNLQLTFSLFLCTIIKHKYLLDYTFIISVNNKKNYLINIENIVHIFFLCSHLNNTSIM